MSGAAVQGGKELRADIQALRGLAIVLVLLHHASFPGIPGGFLGVDIFFVISGFLITGLIVAEIDGRRFSWREFYARRVKRLFPAAYATLVATSVLAPLFLDSVEYRNFAWQLLGSFAFVANVVLWRQSDYFGSGAELKPLLHMWSLSIEEQFYILLPPLLLVCPARLRLPLVAALTVGSAALCALLVQRAPSATFYLLPTRAWELGLGALVAIAVRRGLVGAPPAPALRLLCAGVLVAVPLLMDERGHPGAAAAAVCAATAVLVLPGARPGRLGPALAPLGFVGDRSYSLYLVHWPVFAFANHVSLAPVGLGTNLLLLCVCFAWAELQYRYVEQRYRRTPLTGPRLAALVSVPGLALVASFAVAQSRVTEVTEARAGNHGLSRRCDFGATFEPRPECRDRPAPRTLVWGDSFAMALVEGVRASTEAGVLQATRTVCGPFLGIAPTNGAQYPRAWAESCIRFNQSVLDHIAQDPQIRTVVLSSALVQYLPGAEDRGWRLVVAGADGGTERDLGTEELLEALARTAQAVRALGRHVVLFAPPPAGGFDVARCADRLRGGQPTVPRRASCDIGRASYEEFRGPTLAFLRAVEERKLLPVVSFDEALCHSGACATQLDGVLLYQDATHLSRRGSRLLAGHMNWRDVLYPAGAGHAAR